MEDSRDITFMPVRIGIICTLIHGCCRKQEDMLAEHQLAAGTAAEDAASRLSAAEKAAAEDREKLQEQVASLEQRLSEATAIQEDLATRLQVRMALRNAYSCSRASAIHIPDAMLHCKIHLQPNHGPLH